jgi:hypothetical protein
MAKKGAGSLLAIPLFYVKMRRLEMRNFHPVFLLFYTAGFPERFCFFDLGGVIFCPPTGPFPQNL